MSQVTELASGQLTAVSTITIELVEATETPAVVIIRWPERPCITHPRRFPAAADNAARIGNGRSARCDDVAELQQRLAEDGAEYDPADLPAALAQLEAGGRLGRPAPPQPTAINRHPERPLVLVAGRWFGLMNSVLCHARPVPATKRPRSEVPGVLVESLRGSSCTRECAPSPP